MLRPKPHQKRVIRAFADYPCTDSLGLLLDHSTGSGKTLTSLLSMYQHPEPIIVIGPKCCRPIFLSTIEQAGLDSKRVQIYTFTAAKQIALDRVDFLEGCSVIVDEAHALRNQTMANMTLLSALASATRLILATATPFMNHFADLSVLTNLLQGSDRLPTDRKLFDALYLRTSTASIVNQEILKERLGSHTISYYSMTDDLEHYPKRIDVCRSVVMDSDQIDEYRAYVKRFRYTKDIMDVDDLEDLDFLTMPAKSWNAFLMTTRQISNTSNPSKDSPKMSAIVSAIKDSRRGVVVHSAFLDYGIFCLARQLDRNNISYLTINGHTSPEGIIRNVTRYNQGSVKVLLISSAGSESLHLLNSEQVHLMEVHWNDPKQDQVIGRTIRYDSHKELPYRDREVTVYRWISVFPDYIQNQSADEYLLEISRLKSGMSEQYRRIIESVSIEANAPKK